MTTPTKETILTLLSAWIDQRPGLDPRDYISGWDDRNGRAAYRSDSRKITNDKHDALTLLRAVAHSSITADELTAAFSAYSGRLSLKEGAKGWSLDYCTGQYWPTEYRAAACAVLARALWDYHRTDYANEDRPGDKLRSMFRRMFGRSLASRWLD